MNAHELIKELGRSLGIELKLSLAGTCRASFDGDVVSFELEHDSLWIFAELGPALGRDDAVPVLLAANNFGLQTGGATIALDEERCEFTLHMELWSGMPYRAFEAKLIMFIKTLRWWKDWLDLPPLKAVVRQAHAVESSTSVRGEADGVMEDVYSPYRMSSDILKI